MGSSHVVQEPSVSRERKADEVRRIKARDAGSIYQKDIHAIVVSTKRLHVEFELGRGSPLAGLVVLADLILYDSLSLGCDCLEAVLSGIEDYIPMESGCRIIIHIAGPGAEGLSVEE